MDEFIITKKIGMFKRMANEFIALLTSICIGIIYILTSPISMLNALNKIEEKTLDLPKLMDNCGFGPNISPSTNDNISRGTKEPWKIEHDEEYGED